MKNESTNNTNPEEILKKASETIGTSTEELKNAAKSGNIKDILGKLDKNQTQKLTSMLSDKALTSKLLSSPQAKQLLKK